jgi:hypothetical protein
MNGIVLVIYLFMVYDLCLLLFTYSRHPANISYYSLAVFTATLIEISYIKKVFLKFSIDVKISQNEFYLAVI